MDEINPHIEYYFIEKANYIANPLEKNHISFIHALMILKIYYNNWFIAFKINYNNTIIFNFFLSILS